MRRRNESPSSSPAAPSTSSNAPGSSSSVSFDVARAPVFFETSQRGGDELLRLAVASGDASMAAEVAATLAARLVFAACVDGANNEAAITQMAISAVRNALASHDRSSTSSMPSASLTSPLAFFGRRATSTQLTTASAIAPTTESARPKLRKRASTLDSMQNPEADLITANPNAASTASSAHNFTRDTPQVDRAPSPGQHPTSPRPLSRFDPLKTGRRRRSSLAVDPDTVLDPRLNSPSRSLPNSPRESMHPAAQNLTKIALISSQTVADKPLPESSGAALESNSSPASPHKEEDVPPTEATTTETSTPTTTTTETPTPTLAPQAPPSGGDAPPPLPPKKSKTPLRKDTTTTTKGNDVGKGDEPGASRAPPKKRSSVVRSHDGDGVKSDGELDSSTADLTEQGTPCHGKQSRPPLRRLRSISTPTPTWDNGTICLNRKSGVSSTSDPDATANTDTTNNADTTNIEDTSTKEDPFSSSAALAAAASINLGKDLRFEDSAVSHSMPLLVNSKPPMEQVIMRTNAYARNSPRASDTSVSLRRDDNLDRKVVGRANSTAHNSSTPSSPTSSRALSPRLLRRGAFKMEDRSKTLSQLNLTQRPSSRGSPNSEEVVKPSTSSRPMSPTAGRPLSPSGFRNARKSLPPRALTVDLSGSTGDVPRQQNVSSSGHTRFVGPNTSSESVDEVFESDTSSSTVAPVDQEEDWTAMFGGDLDSLQRHLEGSDVDLALDEGLGTFNEGTAGDLERDNTADDSTTDDSTLQLPAAAVEPAERLPLALQNSTLLRPTRNRLGVLVVPPQLRHSLKEYCDTQVGLCLNLTQSNKAWRTNHVDHGRVSINKLSRALKDNQLYFSLTPAQKNAALLHQCCAEGLSCVNNIATDMFWLSFAADVFDFDSNTRGNGFRSLIDVTVACMNKLCEKLLLSEADRHSVTSKPYSDTHFKHISSYHQLLNKLQELLHLARLIAEQCTCDSLFPPGDHSDILDTVDRMDKDLFYGSKFGFQYPDRLRLVLKTIIVTMTAFSRGYNKHQSEFLQVATTVFTQPMYFMQTEKRAELITREMQKGDVMFLKNFWNLTETTMAKHFPKILSSGLAVNLVLPVPVDMVTVAGSDRPFVDIDPAKLFSYEAETVQCRLLSFKAVRGQIYHPSHLKNLNHIKSTSAGSRGKDPSRGLVIHFHGGGFVAQSSKSHEIYLRDFAKGVRCPILSVDYSLAPDHVFPRAVQECFYVYCWALANASHLGSTAERVVVTGDSAGGNLCFAVSLMAAQYNVRRPDAILASYPALYVRYVPAPSRLLSVMDPLLSTSILKSCLIAYCGADGDDTDPLLSPGLASDTALKTLPETYIFATALDPLLDDSIEFARRLQRLDMDVHLTILSQLPHGFLSFGKLSDQSDAIKSIQNCLCRLLIPQSTVPRSVINTKRRASAAAPASSFI